MEGEGSRERVGKVKGVREGRRERQTDRRRDGERKI